MLQTISSSLLLDNAVCDGVTMDWRLGITTLAAILLFYWNRMARGGIWYDPESCPPFPVLLIMIRSHFKRSP